ncbi:helix-turn-helix transcriptional regulator [Streptomyces sp. NPDC005828]|uniref:telomere-protecting terminal protein Tpg n=1 Tax=Streptomyces sp. NPDC005828 TaxID=3157071 RepID=UPI0033EE66BF
MTGEIDDALERADQEHFTKEPPKGLQARINYLLKQLGTPRAVAEEIGVTADSVNRYRRGARRNPPKHVAAKIEAAVKARWQPGVRRRRRKQAAATGITVETRARFGYKAATGTTDDGRFRRLTVKLPAAYAQRLFDAQDRGLGDQEMREIIAEGFKEIYFQDNGARAMGLSEVSLSDIDYLDIEY